MFFFSFGNHNALLNVLKDINNPTFKRSKKVVVYSFYIEFYVYLFTMFIGYFSTFENTKEIFIDRHEQSFFLLIGKLFYVVALICHIGMYLYISKPSLELVFNKGNAFENYEYIYMIQKFFLSINYPFNLQYNSISL